MLVFAPAGLLLTAAEDLPDLVEKGRSRIELELRNARFVGQLVVTRGQQELKHRIEHLTDRDTRSADAPEPPVEVDASRSPEDAGGGGGPGPASPVTGGRDAGAPPGRPAAGPTAAVTPGGVDWAIPGYDSLSASQVVRRLEALGPQELGAVARYESATRGRRTILHGVQHLLDDRPRATGRPD